MFFLWTVSPMEYKENQYNRLKQVFGVYVFER